MPQHSKEPDLAQLVGTPGDLVTSWSLKDVTMVRILGFATPFEVVQDVEQVENFEKFENPGSPHVAVTWGEM